MDSNALRKPAAKAIFDEFIMPDLLARDHVSSNGMIHIHYIYLLQYCNKLSKKIIFRILKYFSCIDRNNRVHISCLYILHLYIMKNNGTKYGGANPFYANFFRSPPLCTSQNRHRKNKNYRKIEVIDEKAYISIHSRTSMEQIVIYNGISFIMTVILFIMNII